MKQGKPDRKGPVLAINCAESVLQVVAGSARAGVMASSTKIVGKGAMPVLAGAVAGCLQKADLRVKDLAGIVCVSGPGSFTGLRISFALAMGIAKGAGLLIGKVPYLPLLAATAAAGVREEDNIWIITHARKKFVYWQSFSMPGLDSGEPEVLTLDKLTERLAAFNGSLLVAGSGVQKISDLNLQKNIRVEELTEIAPDALVSAALSCELLNKPSFPFYMRPSDAEMNLEAIAAKRGVDPSFYRTF